jgi:predicted nucleotidyltransferase
MTAAGWVRLPGVVTLGSDAHRALIEQVVAHYRQDDRVRAVAVFGSVSTGTWHELSDVDLDVVLDSLEEVSIRWHPLAATSPNICASLRVVYGRLTAAEIIAAGEANRARPDEQRLLDSLVRDALGAWKMLGRGRRWESVAGVERMRRSLLALRVQRDSLRLDPDDPAGALATVLAEAAAYLDFGPRRRALLGQIDAQVFPK